VKYRAAYIINEVKELVDLNLSHPDINSNQVERSKDSTKTEQRPKTIEEIIEEKWAGFEFQHPVIELDEKLKPIESVLYNFFSRGIPTKCTLELENFLLKKYPLDNLSSIPPKTVELLFASKPIDYYLELLSLIKLIEIPILAGQLHKIFSVLITDSSSQEVKVYTDLLDQSVLKIVVREFNEILRAISGMSADPYHKKIVLTTDEEAEYSLTREHHNWSKGAVNEFSFNNPVNYKDYGDQEEEANENNEVISKFNVKDEKVHSGLLYLLQQVFRFEDFHPGQQAIIKRILLRKDVIGLLPTGGGKSLCYQMGGLLQPGITVVVDPINSLMKDQERQLREFGINRSAFINGMLSAEERNKRLENIALNKYLFLFISPERFHIIRYRNALKEARGNGAKFHSVVIDEAHVVSEWGHDFRPSYLKLAFSINQLLSDENSNRPSYIGLTATASFDVLADIQRELTVDESKSLENDAIATLPPDAINREELSFELIDVNYWKKQESENLPWYEREFGIKELKYHFLRKILRKSENKIIKKSNSKSEYKNGIVIFCPTKSLSLPSGVNYMISPDKEDNLFNNKETFKVVSYHSSGSDLVYVDSKIIKNATEAEKNQEKFINNLANVMVCTKGFGMGIDKPNIRATVHYSMPPSLEAFYQEAGRAGRDRKPAKCYMLYDYHDVLLNMDFLENSFINEEKEKTISDEICTKVKFEKKFKRKYLSTLITNLVNNRFDDIRVTLDKKITESGYISLFGKYHKDPEKRINYGGLRVSDLTYSTKFAKNCTQKEIDEVKSALFDVIHEYIHNRGFKLDEYLTSKSDDGLIPKIKNLSAGQSGKLVIGFRNEYIQRLAEIIEEKYPFLKFASLSNYRIKGGCP